MLSIPIVGIGTWQITGAAARKAVREALAMGYRHIDTADAYGNHKEVGKGIKESGIKREDLFLTTKVWRDSFRHDDVISSAQRFLEELQTDYIDLLLMHWPNLDIPLKETLGALHELQKKNIIKAIGVSNFTIPLLHKALATGVPFVNNQVEFHPSLYQKGLEAFCNAHHIVITAYSPIAQGEDLKIPLIQELAKSYGKTPSQIVLNWITRKNIVVIPRSSNPHHMQENLGALSFALSGEDSVKIDALNLHYRILQPPFALFDD